MNSQCLEGAAQSNPCAVVAPEQNSRADPCPCQDVCPSCPSCPCDLPLGVPSPSLPADSGPRAGADPAKIPSSGEEPFTLDTPGMCTMKFPLQKSILTVELCPPDPPGASPLPQDELRVTKTCPENLENLEKLPQELPVAAPEPCTLEVLDLGADEPCQSGISMDPCTSQSGISMDPCASQSGISTDPCASQSGISTDPCASQSGISMDPCASQSRISMDPCASQSGISTDPCPSQSQGLGDAGDAKESRSQTSPRIPFRLNSCTSSIVERCLSRCQSWFRGKK